MSLPTIKGKVFIVPNKAADISRNIEAGCTTFIDIHNHKVDDFDMADGYHLKEGDVAVQIWFANEICDNWGCHGVPWSRTEVLRGTKDFDKLKNPRAMYNFIERIPARMLENVHEGDIITMYADGLRIEAVACQLGSRYESFGRFEEAFEHVTA